MILYSLERYKKTALLLYFTILYKKRHCHERQLQGLERKAKVEGSQLRLYKAKEGRNMKLSACLNILGSPILA